MVRLRFDVEYGSLVFWLSYDLFEIRLVGQVPFGCVVHLKISKWFHFYFFFGFLADGEQRVCSLDGSGIFGKYSPIYPLHQPILTWS